MLGKLIKYDIRSTWRDFAAVYVSIILGVLILPQVFKNINNEVFHVIAVLLAIGIVIATIAVMVIMLFRIFNTNVFSKEGYLLMTLPVTSTKIVASKLIVSSMWIVLTGIVSAIGLFIFFFNVQEIPSEIFDLMKSFFSIIGGNGQLAIILLAVSAILSTVKEIAKLFLACAIAHLKQLERLRILVGILSYFIFSWMEVLVVQALMFVISLLPSTAAFIQRMEEMNQLSHLANFPEFIGVFNGVVAAGMVYSLFLVVAYAIGTVWVLNRKLDLD